MLEAGWCFDQPHLVFFTVSSLLALYHNNTILEDFCVKITIHHTYVVLWSKVEVDSIVMDEKAANIGRQPRTQRVFNGIESSSDLQRG